MIDINYCARAILHLFLACVLDTWSSALSFCRFRSHRWSYCSRHISTFEYGISRAWNSGVDTEQDKTSISFFHLTLRTVLSSLISDYYFRYDLYFFLSNLLSRVSGELIILIQCIETWYRYLLKYEYTCIYFFLFTRKEIHFISYYQRLHVLSFTFS